MNAIISVVGKDTIGILGKVATKCSEFNANVVDVTQTVISGFFTMFMVVDIDNVELEFNDFVDIMVNFGTKEELKINVMHEDIFNLMHKI